MDTATATPRQKIKKRETTAPELLSLRDTLSLALEAAEQGENTALQRAIEAGRVVVEVKEYLRQNPLHLLDFKSFWARYFKGKNRRTANTYERVYRQVKVDSSVNYPSISECLAAYRKANPPKKRFTPDAKEAARKKLLDSLPKPDHPPEERPPSMPTVDWLGDDEPEDEVDPEEPKDMMALEAWVTAGCKGEWKGSASITVSADFTLRRRGNRVVFMVGDKRLGGAIANQGRFSDGEEFERLIRDFYSTAGRALREAIPRDKVPLTSRTPRPVAPATPAKRTRKLNRRSAPAT